MADSSYGKIQEFLSTRSMDYLISGFVVNKIDDTVASQCTDEKLLQLGLVYGDLLSFRKHFPGPKTEILDAITTVKSYSERAEELKQKLKRTHTGRINACQRPVTIKANYHVSFGLKCWEKSKYRLKLNKGFAEDVDREAKYNDVHEICRTYFQIPSNIKSYIGLFGGGKIEKTFICLDNFAQLNREKKKALHFYLYVPISYSNLQFKTLIKEVSVEEGDTFEIDELFDEKEDDNDSINSADNSNFSATTNPVSSSIFTPTASVSNSNLKREICLKCYSSYTSSVCIICEQHAAYEESLKQDQKKEEDSQHAIGSSAAMTSITGEDSLSHENESTSEVSVEDAEHVRESRLRHFRQRPIRYRSSIGSPSLLQTFTAISNSSNYFGDNEVDRFLDYENVDHEEIIELEEKDELKQDVGQFIRIAKANFESAIKSPIIKHIIIQRDPSRFWNVLWRQKFDLSKETIMIRFAGEAGADAGGPLREFLTLAMQRFSKISGLLFGEGEVCFKLVPQSLLDRSYYKLGQLTGLAIVIIGRGPECLNPIIVNTLFNQQPSQISFVKDAELSYKLKNIQDGNDDELFEYNISPSVDRAECQRLFLISYVLLRNSAAIQQFMEGLKSISDTLAESSSYSVMKSFLLRSEKCLSLGDILSHINCHNDAEPGSNTFQTVRNLICDFEVFLAEVSNGDIENAGLEQILFLFTGVDRLPPDGLGKKIDIFFDEKCNFPKISTCGLTATFPTKEFVKYITIAIDFGGGFGDI